MQKIILTIIILAVAKSVFAAPNPTYLDRDATKLQTVSFPITPSGTRRDALDAADISNTAAAQAALAKAKEAPKGSEALRIAENIYRVITDKNSCIKDDSRDCSEDEIHYEEKTENLKGKLGEKHTWRVPKGVVKVTFILTSGIGQVEHKPFATDTWLFGDRNNGGVVAHGNNAFGNRLTTIPPVIITQAHRNNGIKYHKGIGSRRSGKIRATFKEPR